MAERSSLVISGCHNATIILLYDLARPPQGDAALAQDPRLDRTITYTYHQNILCNIDSKSARYSILCPTQYSCTVPFLPLLLQLVRRLVCTNPTDINILVLTHQQPLLIGGDCRIVYTLMAVWRPYTDGGYHSLHRMRAHTSLITSVIRARNTLVVAASCCHRFDC